MARYSKSASGDVKRAMKRRKTGALKSGRSGKTVKSKKQAIAIGLSEARAKGRRFRARSRREGWLRARASNREVFSEAWSVVVRRVLSDAVSA